MNYLGGDDLKEQRYPAQIQSIIEKINNLYQQLDSTESRIEENIMKQGRQRRKNVQSLTYNKNELEKNSMEQLEQFKSLIQELERSKTDGFIKIDDYETNCINVSLSRYKQLYIGKQQAFNQMITQIQKLIITTQEMDDVEVKTQDQQENQRLLQTDIELAKHEEMLDRDEKDIKQIHQDVNEIVDLVSTITTEVREQRGVVNQIEDRVNAADQDMDEGLDELLAAQGQQNKGKKLRNIFLGLAIAAAVVIAVALMIALL
uniref:SNARE, putative n=1 Tax=Trepomonas sp. PC1 TaxID=1076344 RepID=A0A146KF74_9EUKA|eukprot:JAP94838.1 SNARE, putative [Trepomonas sp. PC1]